MSSSGSTLVSQPSGFKVLLRVIDPYANDGLWVIVPCLPRAQVIVLALTGGRPEGSSVMSMCAGYDITAGWLCDLQESSFCTARE